MAMLLSWLWSGTSIGTYLLVGALVLGFSGCLGRSETHDASEKSAIGDSLPTTVSQDVFDAGIVFLDQSSYLCLPITRLGIENDSAVVSVTSSCECVRPTIVRYLAPSDEIGKALRVDFVADVSSDKSRSPAPLGIEVRLKLENGVEKVVRFDLLLTVADSKT